MKKYLISLCQVLIYFVIALVLLVLVDLFIRDKIHNPHVNEVFDKGELGGVVFIGSSKLFYHHVDSILDKSGSYSYLSWGGQYNYASISIFKALARKGLLRDKLVFIDLQDNDELETGFVQWWYFAEAFLTEGTASWQDYPLSDWPKIIGRIVVDATDFKGNRADMFNWIPFEEGPGKDGKNVDEERLNDFINDYNNPEFKSSHSRPFVESLKRFKDYSTLIESDYNTKVFLILAPGVTKGSLAEINRIYGRDRVINMTKLITNPSYYHDDYHLNEDGAKIFTEELLRIIEDVD